MISEAEKLLHKESNNFNLIRLLAALVVIITHSYSLTGRPENDWLVVASGGLLSFSRLGVYIFFIISGFLISFSLDRTSRVVHFFINRFLRIFPALIIVILFTVFVVGPVVTNLGMMDYFSNYQTYRYLGGMTLYRITYDLPGIFLDNPYRNAVNGSLWTLPYEWTCYMVLAVFLLFKKNKKWMVLISFFVLLFAKIFLADFFIGKFVPLLLLEMNKFLNFLMLFILGSIGYFFRDKLKFNFWILASVSAVFILFSQTSLAIYFLYPTLTYVILYFARVDLPFRKFFVDRDYSYGLYIYAFLIQQLLAKYLGVLGVLQMAVLAIIFTFPLAIFSWHFIERPALKLKNINYKSIWNTKFFKPFQAKIMNF